MQTDHTRITRPIAPIYDPRTKQAGRGRIKNLKFVRATIRHMKQMAKANVNFRFEMADWIQHNASVKPKRGAANYCGTAACFAGSLALAAGCKPTDYLVPGQSIAPKLAKLVLDFTPTIYRTDNSAMNCSRVARTVLGLSEDESELLFMPTSWPGKFDAQYREATTELGKIQALEARVNHYIKTGE